MELIRRIHSARARDCVVTIGTFDGLHLGHCALIERLLVHARARCLPSMMLSFEPMPREILHPLDPPARLTSFRERWRLLQGHGIDQFCVLHFDKALRSLSALQFMQMLQQARARCVIVGHDFRFGHGGEAGTHWACAHAAAFDFEIEVVPPVLVDGERVSSGLVRSALLAGDLARTQHLLGRAYSMRARVQRGNRLGRELGFPTANLPVHRRRVAVQGIFAVRVHGPDLRGWPAVASLGTRPVIGGKAPLLEVHLFDFAGDLYGCELEVQFIAKLRDERNFASLDAMVVQMRCDAAEARAILGVK